MARIELHRIYPFRAGTTRPISDDHFLTIEMETAKSKAGCCPFEIVEYMPGYDPFVYSRNQFSLVTDACAALDREVTRMTEDHSDYQPAE